MAKTQPNERPRVTQPEVNIDPEFQKLLPVLTPEEFASLEQDIRDNGCRDALVIARFTENGEQKERLIDGHNRLTICLQHNLPFRTNPPIIFTSREEVKKWIVDNQKNRRNMTKFRWVELALNYYGEEFAKKAKENQKKGGQGYTKSDEPVNTLEKIGEIANAAPDTVVKVKHILEKASEEVKNRLRMGEVGYSINKVYMELMDKKDNPDSKTKKGSKITLDSEENNKGLRKIFGNKFSGILKALDEFESKLQKDKDKRAIKSLKEAIKSLNERVGA